jgi:hypothetical protein
MRRRSDGDLARGLGRVHGVIVRLVARFRNAHGLNPSIVRAAPIGLGPQNAPDQRRQWAVLRAGELLEPLAQIRLEPHMQRCIW